MLNRTFYRGKRKLLFFTSSLCCSAGLADVSGSHPSAKGQCVILRYRIWRQQGCLFWFFFLISAPLVCDRCSTHPSIIHFTPFSFFLCPVFSSVCPSVVRPCAFVRARGSGGRMCTYTRVYVVVSSICVYLCVWMSVCMCVCVQPPQLITVPLQTDAVPG